MVTPGALCKVVLAAKLLLLVATEMKEISVFSRLLNAAV